MPNIIFTHPEIDESLIIDTGANQISWAYNLITQSYPTYAGEVVQVLSCNIDNIKVEGEIRSYSEMENIYRWFLLYMQKATQGQGGDQYVGSPVKMEYPHRGWTLYIKPISLPAMRYGREVVVPSWSLEAHVEDPDPEMRDLTIDHTINGEIENFKQRVTADIGFRRANPFSDPLAVITKEEKDLYYPDKQLPEGLSVQGEKVQNPDWGGALQGLAKQMNAMFGALMQGEVKDLIQTTGIRASQPATSSTSTQPSTTSKQGHK